MGLKLVENMLKTQVAAYYYCYYIEIRIYYLKSATQRSFYN